MTQDDRGKRVPAYLAQLAEAISVEQQGLLGELQSLQKNIDHIKVIVSMQQFHAKSGGMLENVRLSDVLEDAVMLSNLAFHESGVTIIRDYGDTPTASVDRHKILQIVMNLLSNARHAVTDAPDRTIIVRCRTTAERLVVDIEDRGRGIPAENLTRIFNYGFTTKKAGHGFGLHSSANTAKEIGGSLTCRSAGEGAGAMFTLNLPLLRVDDGPALPTPAFVTYM